MSPNVSIYRLSNLAINDVCQIAKFDELPEKEVKRLRDLGLNRGCMAKIVTVTENGPFLIAVGDVRIAVNRDVAAKIKVFSKTK